MLFAAERGFAVDEEGYRALVQKQRATAKADYAAKASSSWADNSIKLDLPKTAFVGYTENEIQSKVLTVLKDGEESFSAGEVEALQIDEEGEFRDFLENNRQYWDYVDDALLASMRGKCRVTFYLPEGEDGFQTLGQTRVALAALKARRPEYAPLLLTMEMIKADAKWYQAVVEQAKERGISVEENLRRNAKYTIETNKKKKEQTNP